MVDLSGDVWGRIDEDAADGAPEQPVDVWLQQRMSANSTHKARGIEAITCTLCAGTQDVDGAPFIGPFLMDQTWCSYRWSSPITIPVRLLEGVASIDLEVYASIHYEAVDYDVDYRLELYENDRLISSDSGTWTGQKGYETYTATVALDTPAQYDRWVQLRLYIRNEPGNALGAPKTGTGSMADRFFASSHVSLAPYSARPNTHSHDVIYLSITSDWLGGDPGAADILFSDSANKRFGMVEPDGLAELGYGATYDEIELRYLQVRAATIRVRYADDVYRAIPQRSLPSQVAVRGELAMRQAYQEQRQWTRDRLVAWGPPGYGYYHTTTESLEIRRWRYHMADELTPRPLLDESIQIRGGSTVVVGMLVAGLYYAQAPEGQETWIEYDFDAALQRLSGGSWTDIATATETVQVNTYVVKSVSIVSAETLSTPLMFQRWWEYSQTFVVGERMLATAEGQLWDADMPLLSFVELEIDASSVTDLEDAVRLQITPDYTGSSAIITGDTALNESAAELMLVGYSVYTRS